MAVPNDIPEGDGPETPFATPGSDADDNRPILVASDSRGWLKDWNLWQPQPHRKDWGEVAVLARWKSTWTI
jgi:hypothetical protein